MKKRRVRRLPASSNLRERVAVVCAALIVPATAFTGLELPLNPNGVVAPIMEAREALFGDSTADSGSVRLVVEATEEEVAESRPAPSPAPPRRGRDRHGNAASERGRSLPVKATEETTPVDRGTPSGEPAPEVVASVEEPEPGTSDQAPPTRPETGHGEERAADVPAPPSSGQAPPSAPITEVPTEAPADEPVVETDGTEVVADEASEPQGSAEAGGAKDGTQGDAEQSSHDLLAVGGDDPPHDSAEDEGVEPTDEEPGDAGEEAGTAGDGEGAADDGEPAEVGEPADEGDQGDDVGHGGDDEEQAGDTGDNGEPDDDQENGNGNGNGHDNGHGNGNGHGQGDGQGHDHGNGHGNGNGNGHDEDEGDGDPGPRDNGNSNGQGNDNGQGNSNGQGNGNGQGSGNGRDNGNGQGNGGGAALLVPVTLLGLAIRRSRRTAGGR